MKRLSLFLAFLLCVGLAGCAETPQGPSASLTTAPSTTTAYVDPTVKTIFVHTSVTTASDTMDATTEYLYDENDHLVEVIQYSGTSQTQRYSVVCDENGNFIQWNTTVGELSLSIQYSYDAEGRKLGSSQYHNDELMSSTVYTWNGDLLVQTLSVMPAQNSELCARYTYNSQGIRVREDHLINNVVVRYGIYTNDDSGRVLTVNYYLSSGVRESLVEYTYEGLTQTKITYAADGTMQQKAVVTYDEFGNLLCTQTYDSQNKLISTETHTWKAIQVSIDCPRASA